jgi:tryptophan synthase alpha chain
VNRIDAVFEKLHQLNRTALMPFVTAGDPDLDTTLEIIVELERAGADMIELGVPYSDPLADGPVIQRASERALAHRITILDCIELAGRVRERGVQLPIILFTYYNPALQTGLERLFQLMSRNGISGLIIPDLPIEENEEVRALSVRHDIHLIPLVAPTSKHRIEAIVQQAAGFVYCVSSLGVTGMRSEFDTGIESFLQTVKNASPVPIAIGFGISKAEHVRRFGQICDGVIVGSALVHVIEKALPLLKSEDRKREGLEQIYRFVRELRGA